jgi:hypothetical protein
VGLQYSKNYGKINFEDEDEVEHEDEDEDVVLIYRQPEKSEISR